jgi:E3 ubiquitin-protein ligase SHPRH
LIRCAQLQQRDDENPDHYHHALETLSLAEKESNQMIDSVRAAIADHEATGEVLKKEATTLKEARRQSPSPGPEDHPMDNGKGKARERIASTPLADMDDLDDSDLLNTPAGEEHTNKGRSLQQRLRECYVCLHRVKFLQGDAYHSLGASHSPSEDAAYFAAEEMRRNLLKSECRFTTYLRVQTESKIWQLPKRMPGVPWIR